MKKAFCLLLLLLFLPVSALADGQTGTSNYLYTIHGEAVSAPPAFKYNSHWYLLSAI